MTRDVDPAWWDSEWEGRDMRAVLAAHDVGGVFRFLHHRGWSWSGMANATGLTDSRVREIARGQREVVNYAVLDRIAAGLRIPLEYMGLGRGAPPPSPARMAPALDDTVCGPGPRGPGHDRQVLAVRRALTFATSAGTDAAIADSPIDGQPAQLKVLQLRIAQAWTARTRSAPQRPLLVLVGGFAGSGKSEFSQFLAASTGWALLDKDTLTRPLTESMLSALGADPNDRHTPTYQRQVRPLEYRSLFNATFANLAQGNSTVATAPLLSELPDRAWLSRLARRCQVDGVDLATIWVDADAESMYTYLQLRDAARDTWKLNHWDDYLASVDLTTRPGTPHVVIDNDRHAAVALAEQAHRFAEAVADAR